MKEYDKLRSEYGKLEIIWGHSGDNSNYDSIDYIPQESWLRNLVKIHHHTVMITMYLDGIRELSKKRQGRTNHEPLGNQYVIGGRKARLVRKQSQRKISVERLGSEGYIEHI